MTLEDQIEIQTAAQKSIKNAMVSQIRRMSQLMESVDDSWSSDAVDMMARSVKGMARDLEEIRQTYQTTSQGLALLRMCAKDA
tara:strand:- start:7578 stop:7826 length:249 start_codon:yes stop_codon:yes gene_type:complete